MPIEPVLIGLAAIVAILVILPAGRRLIATAIDIVDASVAMFAFRRTFGLDTTTARQRRIDERNAREQAEILRRIGGDVSVGAAGTAPTRLVVTGDELAPPARPGPAAAPPSAPADRAAMRSLRIRDAAVATVGLALVIGVIGVFFAGQPSGGVLGTTATPEARTGVVRASRDPLASPAGSDPVAAAPGASAGPTVDASASPSAPAASAASGPGPSLAAAPAVERRTMRLAGPTAGGPTVRIRLGWDLAQGSPPAATFLIERQVGDAAFTRVARLPGDARTVVVTAPVGSTSTFRITAAAPDGASRSTIAWAPVTPGRTQESGGAVALRGAWRGASGPSLSGGGVVYTRTTSARATFRFRGTDVGWIATLTPMSGRADVRIDGATVGTVDLRGGAVRYRQLVFRHHLATGGEHRLEIMPLGGGRVDIDGFVTLR